MPTLTEQALIDLPQGWFNHGPHVLRLIEQYRPKIIVELGSWFGASSIAMARSARRWGGTVTCVDTWAGELDIHGGSEAGKAPMMILPCARNMVEAGVSASLRLIPAMTVAAAKTWDRPIDFLYIDADHSYRGVCADLAAWAPHVRPGGLIAGDDYAHPLYPGVQQAWDEFTAQQRWTATHYQSDPPHRGGVQLVYVTVPGGVHG